jgi:hypothetical protein
MPKGEGFDRKVSAGRKNKGRCFLAVGLMALLLCLGTVFLIYSITGGKYLFSVCYLIAILLGLSYIIIKLNTVLPIYIAAEGETLYLKNWNNGFVPYSAYYRIPFLREFLPAKTRREELPLDDIVSILIGTKNFVKRHCRENRDFLTRMEEFEQTHPGYGKGVDLCYIELRDGKTHFINIGEFDIKAMADMMCYLEDNSMAEIKCNHRELFKLWQKIRRLEREK